MYPHTQKTFTVNGQGFRMWAPTLLFKSKLEDENSLITYSDILKECTDIPEQLFEIMPIEEVEKICEDAMTFWQKDSTQKGGDNMTASSIIALLLNRGHNAPQEYRLDFVQIIFEEYSNGKQ